MTLFRNTAIVCLALFCAAAAQAATRLAIVPVPPAAEARAQTLSPKIGPVSRNFVVVESRKQLQSGNMSADLVRADAMKAGISTSDMDIDALVQAILFQMAADAEDDLREQIAQMKKEIEQKKAQRDQVTQMRNTQSAMRAQIARSFAPAASYKVDQYGTGKRAGLNAAVRQMQDQMDSLSDLTEEQQLRLQMYMERYSKAMEMLSNMMKKLSETQNTLIKNLK